MRTAENGGSSDSNLLSIILQKLERMEKKIDRVLAVDMGIRSVILDSVDLDEETGISSKSNNSTSSLSSAGRKRKKGGDSSAIGYNLSRDIRFVPELWKEWTVGLTDDLPSVNYINETCGTSWRSTGKERKYYSNRKAVIDEVKANSADQNLEEDETVLVLENSRTNQRLTFNKLMMNLVERNQNIKKQQQQQQQQ